jgi:hypothetical protein
VLPSEQARVLCGGGALPSRIGHALTLARSAWVVVARPGEDAPVRAEPSIGAAVGRLVF